MYADESSIIYIPVSWITCNFTINLNSALRIDTVSLRQLNGRTEYPVCLGEGWCRQWESKGVKGVQWIETKCGNDLVTLQGRALKGPSLLRHWKCLCSCPQQPGVHWVTISGSRDLSESVLFECDSVTLNRDSTSQWRASLVWASWGTHKLRTQWTRNMQFPLTSPLEKARTTGGIFGRIWGIFAIGPGRSIALSDPSPFGPCNVLSAHLSLYNCLNCCQQLMIVNRSLTTENTWSQ